VINELQIHSPGAAKTSGVSPLLEARTAKMTLCGSEKTASQPRAGMLCGSNSTLVAFAQQPFLLHLHRLQQKSSTTLAVTLARRYILVNQSCHRMTVEKCRGVMYVIRLDVAKCPAKQSCIKFLGGGEVRRHQFNKYDFADVMFLEETVLRSRQDKLTSCQD